MKRVSWSFIYIKNLDESYRSKAYNYSFGIARKQQIHAYIVAVKPFWSK